MTPEAQHVALMEWMGWTDIVNNPNRLCVVGCAPGAKFLGLVALPPLSLDLMHEAAMKLKGWDAKAYLKYHQALIKLDGWYYPDATAEQRREALLKTVGMWKE